MRVMMLPAWPVLMGPFFSGEPLMNNCQLLVARLPS